MSMFTNVLTLLNREMLQLVCLKEVAKKALLRQLIQKNSPILNLESG